MKIWLSKNSEIPVREQLITQITLGIASGDLPIGQKLPSTRQIARRFQVHSNTVSGAYQKLADQGWLEFRKGSGFYVSQAQLETLENSLDKIIAQFFRHAQEQGFTISEIKKRLSHFFKVQSPELIVVVEDDIQLRNILIEEIREATGFMVSGMSLEEFEHDFSKTNAIFVAMFDEKPKITEILPHRDRCAFLKARSVADSMQGETRPSPDDLIALVSGWENFLMMAKTLLVAARIEPECLIVRSTVENDWQKGLNSASMIICDSLTAKNFPRNSQLRIFRIIADDSIQELKRITGKCPEKRETLLDLSTA